MNSKKYLNLIIILGLIGSAVTQATVTVVYQKTTTSELGEIYVCFVDYIDYSGIEEELIIDGQHLPDQSNSNVEALYFQSGYLKEIPSQFFKKFPNTKLLKIAPNMGLSTISQAAFDGASNLRYLEITGNPISSLSDLIFSAAYRIESINLSKNAITEISTNTFAGLMSLKNIDLSNNMITTVDSKLSTLINLSHLDLSGNNLQQITPYSFGGLIQLKNLQLSDNHILFIHLNTFNMLYSLETVNLDNNFVGRIPTELFGRNFAMTHLSLKNTLIDAIQPNFMESFLQIQTLDLTQNNCVNEVIVVNRAHLEQVYEILKVCFENFDEDGTTTTEEPSTPVTEETENPTNMPSSPIETSANPITTNSPETTTAGAACSYCMISNLVFIILAGVLSKIIK